MATTFPTTLQDLDATRGTTTQRLNSPSHVTHHTLEDDTTEALQTKVGIDGSAVTTSLDYLVKNTNSNAVTYSGNIKLTGNPQFTNGLYDTNGNEELRIVTTASAVNEFRITNAATTANPLFEVTGDDTNIGLDISSKGTGSVTIWTGAKAREALILVNTASAVNEITITQAATGNAPKIAASGGDTNIPLLLTGKGTGKIRIGDAADNTKLLTFELVNATTAKTMTITSSHTLDRTLTFPDTTDTLVGKATTDTLTNKRRQHRVYSAANNASLTPEIDTYDIFHLTAMSAATTINNHSTSTPADGEMMIIRFLDNGTARDLTWGTAYVAKAGIALPTTTTVSKNLSCLFQYNTNLAKWNLLASGLEV